MCQFLGYFFREESKSKGVIFGKITNKLIFWGINLEKSVQGIEFYQIPYTSLEF